MSPSPADSSISELVDQGRLESVGDHWSDADVFLLSLEGSEYGYLKVAPVSSWYPLRDEAARLDWVRRRVATPEWWKFESDGVSERLLTAAVPGRSLRRWGDELTPSEHVALHAASLRAVHDTLPLAECPFTLTNDNQVQLSQRLREAGKTDSDYLAELTGGWTVDQAFAFLQEHFRPEHLNDVVLHGDPYAANLIVDRSGPQTWALIDWGWCGVGDRWHDLTNVYVHLQRRLGLRWADAFLTEYGVERDDDALLFFRVLDGLR